MTLLPLPTSADATAPRLLILYTGGTIGMAVNKRQELVPMRFEKMARQMRELRRVPYQLALLALPKPIDSSNIAPADWLLLAGLIEQHYAAFEGFVVLHGTDTMAYSAGALSYLLDDVSRRFGTLRAGQAESFLRSDDEAALAELVHSPGASALRLRRILPGTAGASGHSSPGTTAAPPLGT